MKITSIEINEKNKSFARVEVDDSIYFCMTKKRLSELSLEAGSEIEPERLDYLLTTEVYAAAKSAAVSYLSLKLRTVFEVSQKLAEIGFDEEIIDKVIQDLVQIEYLDDGKYTEKFISEKTRLKPMSAKMLAMELKFRGIPQDIIVNALENFDIDDENTAYGLLKKKYSYCHQFDEKTIQKMRSFLINRGFSFEQTSKAITRLISDAEIE